MGKRKFDMFGAEVFETQEDYLARYGKGALDNRSARSCPHYKTGTCTGRTQCPPRAFCWRQK